MSIDAALRRVVDRVLDRLRSDVVQLGADRRSRGTPRRRPSSATVCCFSCAAARSRRPDRLTRCSMSQRPDPSASWPASRRARRSRSVTSRSMRAAWRWMMSRNRSRVSSSSGVVDQRFGVALDRRQRRAQLVRDVGDEVAADLIGAAQIGDVVQHEHRAAARGDNRRDARDERAARCRAPATARDLRSARPRARA